jgi:hypothetical protein
MVHFKKYKFQGGPAGSFRFKEMGENQDAESYSLPKHRCVFPEAELRNSLQNSRTKDTDSFMIEFRH